MWHEFVMPAGFDSELGVVAFTSSAKAMTPLVSELVLLQWRLADKRSAYEHTDYYLVGDRGGDNFDGIPCSHFLVALDMAASKHHLGRL